MYKASNNYLESASALSRESRSKIVLDGKIYDGSKYIKTYPKFSHENEKIIGGFPIKSCSFEFWIKEGYVDFENKEFEVYKGLIINDSVEWIPQGIFKASVEDIKSSDSGLYLTITGYDRTKEAGTILFDDPNDYPCNSLVWIKKSLLKYGYELENENFPHDDIISEKPNYLETTYLREAISRYAEIRGCIALFSRTGKIEIKRPTETGLKYYFYQYSKLTKEKKFGNIDMIVLGRKNINNDITYPSVQELPSPKFEWRIEDNPFVDLVREQTAKFVYNNLKDLSIIPFEAINILDNFLLDINDIVEIQTKDGNWIKTTILSVQTENRIRCTIKAGVQNKTTSNYPLAGSTKESIRKVQLDVDHNKQRIEALASEVTENAEKTNKLEMTVDETKQTISKVETTVEDMITTTQTSSGRNHLYLEKALEQDALEYYIKGKSEQEVSDNSPSPDYPSEIKSIAKEGDIKLKITGKNLLNAPYNEEDKLTRTATKNDDYKSTDFYAELEAGKQYTFSCKTSGTFGMGNTFQTEVFLLFDKKYDYFIHVNSKDGFAFIPNKSGKYYLRTDVNFKDETHSFWNFQIEEGEVATPYEEYKEKEVLVDLNKYDEEGNIVGNYELSSLPNGTSNDLDIVDGQVVINERVGKVVLDGSENWELKQNKQYMFQLLLDNISLLLNTTTKGTIISDYFPTMTPSLIWAENIDGITNLSDAHYIRIKFKDSPYTTVENFKTWLSENPVTVYYELAEPRQIILSNVQIPLFEGINHVSLVEDIETNTSIKFLCETPYSEYYATRQEVKTTKNDLQSEIKETADSIKSSVSATYSTKEETSEAKQGAIDSANSNTTEKLKEYSTTTEMNTAIEQKVSQESASIKSNISATYSTKTETAAAKTDAINSANSSTDNKLKSYSTTTQMNNAITQKVTETTNEINLEVAKKVNEDDFIGANIILKINNDESEAQITADKIVLTANDILDLIAGNELNLTSKNIIIKADNCSIDKDGNAIFNNATLNNITINGGNIVLEDSQSASAIKIISAANDNIFTQYNSSGMRLSKNGIQTVLITNSPWDDGGYISVGTNSTDETTTITKNGISTPMITAGGNRCVTSPYVHWLNFVNTGSSNYMEINLYNPFADVSAFGVNVWASDKRLKKNIIDSKYSALEIIKQIKHREFDYKSGGHVKLGYIADELEEIDKDLIFEVGEDKIKQPSIDKLIPLLSKAIQEQQIIIENLIERIEKLENETNN